MAYNIFERWPFTSFQNLNLDWLITAMKEAVEKSTNAEETAENLKQFVNTYFDNLDVHEEINNKIDEMVASGEFLDTFDQLIPSIVSAWLQENITPTSPAVDASLTISGAAADAKVTGDGFNSVKATTDGILIEWDQTVDTPQNVLSTLDQDIPTGTELTCVNKSSSTPINFSFQDATGVRQFQLYVEPDVVRTVTSTGNPIHRVQTYVNGTEYKAEIRYGSNLAGSLENLENDFHAETEMNVQIFDGYYSDSGALVPPAGDAEKRTDKIKCFTGMKLLFSLRYNTESHLMWNGLCIWKKNGTFIRTAVLAQKVRREWQYTYTAAADDDYVSLCYRSFNDADFHVYSMNNSAEIYNIITGETAGNAIYKFGEYTIKGVNHRGYNLVAPENTIPAYQLSVEHGFKFVETDVRFTSDNVPVLLHDATVDRTSNGTGEISQMTYAQARALDFGSWKSAEYAGTKIPSFEEFIVFCKRTNIYPYIELSGDVYSLAQIEILYNIVKRYGMERAVTWIGSIPQNLNKIKEFDKGSRFGVITWGAATSSSVDIANNLKTGINDVFLNMDIRYINDTLPIAQTAGLPLELWTSNSESEMRNVDSYVNGIASDEFDYSVVMKEYALA